MECRSNIEDLHLRSAEFRSRLSLLKPPRRDTRGAATRGAARRGAAVRAGAVGAVAGVVLIEERSEWSSFLRRPAKVVMRLVGVVSRKRSIDDLDVRKYTESLESMLLY